MSGEGSRCSRPLHPTCSVGVRQGIVMQSHRYPVWRLVSWHSSAAGMHPTMHICYWGVLVTEMQHVARDSSFLTACVTGGAANGAMWSHQQSPKHRLSMQIRSVRTSSRTFSCAGSRRGPVLGMGRHCMHTVSMPCHSCPLCMIGIAHAQSLCCQRLLSGADTGLLHHRQPSQAE